MSDSQKKKDTQGLGNSVATTDDTQQVTEGSLLSNQQQAIFLAAGLIVLAVAITFSNSLSGPFILDDESSIAKNLTIRNLESIGEVLSPPNDGETVTGRPLLNLTLAINYAISGLDPSSYHVTNLFIHILGSLLLFDILRRTFLLPTLRDRWGNAAIPLAFAVALLWAIHPLQTESVTYIAQRAESLVGLFYLLTLYCFLRGTDSIQSVWWYVAAVATCTLGMASKEIMVSAPLIVWLYDRTFVAGSFREAWRKRCGFYLALASTWLLLGWLVISTGTRGGTAGFGSGISWWAYLCTQFGAIVHYLRLCFWPSPLVFDYGDRVVQDVAEIVPYAILVIILGIATVVALWRWPKVGFLGTWFFVILAPTSSIVPVTTQIIAEHRMYLPLAAVIVCVVVGGFYVGQQLVQRGMVSLKSLEVTCDCLVLFLGLILGIFTFQRNTDYSSALSIWEDTVAKVPASARAHNNLGLVLADQEKFDEAIVQYRTALEIDPNSEKIHDNLGVVLSRNGQVDEAIIQYRKALEINPNTVSAYSNLGNALNARGQYEEALTLYNKALELNPNLEIVYNNIGAILAHQGQMDKAVIHFKKALELQPQYVDAYKNLGTTLANQGLLEEATVQFHKVLDLNPENTQVREYLNQNLAKQEEIQNAMAKQRNLLHDHPKDTALLNNVAWKLAASPYAFVRNGIDAVRYAQRAAELTNEQDPTVLDTLSVAYAEAGQFSDAVETAQKAVNLAMQQNKPALADSIKARISLYEAKTPFHDAMPFSASPKK